MTLGTRPARFTSERGSSKLRQDVEFDAEGSTVRGWLYLPEDASEPVPAVVMAHGFSGVKEAFLDRYADVFSDGGLAVVVFDYRNFGTSAGEPRQEVDPWRQIHDYRHAITYAMTRPEIDPNRIGVWGTSLVRPQLRDTDSPS